MENKMKNEKSAKEFLKTKIKSASNGNHVVSPATIEEHIFIGHSRNSRKVHYYPVCRD
jgi:hypothetical protein